MKGKMHSMTLTTKNTKEEIKKPVSENERYNFRVFRDFRGSIQSTAYYLASEP